MPLAELFAQHHVELYRYVARFTGDPDLAEDVVQDVFVRLSERPPADQEHVRGWLFRVATTIAIDAMRGARRRLALVQGRPDRQPMGDPPPDPEAELEREETRRRVREALVELGAKEDTVRKSSTESAGEPTYRERRRGFTWPAVRSVRTPEAAARGTA